MHAELPYLHEILLFLGAATVLVPLLKRMRMSPVLGYLIVGIIIGPYGIHKVLPDHPFFLAFTVTDYELVKPLAEWGVVFLLFTIGLEMSFKRLWQMRNLIFGLGTAQVVLTGFAIGAVAWIWGNGPYAAFLIGASFALSSTAVVTKLLFDHRDFATPAGQAGFSVLLLQDLAVIPLIIFIGVLGAGGEEVEFSQFLLYGFLKALILIGVATALGLVVLRPVYRYVARAGSAELFTALTLLIVISASVLTSAGGMSMALGAFLAGLLLSGTEYRHQIEADIEPFKGLLLGLFFMSVGMGINIAAIADVLVFAVLSVLGLFVIKSLLLTGLGMLFRLGVSVSLQAGIMLGQAGEFAFILLGLAAAKGIVPEETFQFMLMVASLSLLTAPLQYNLARFLAHKFPASLKDYPSHRDIGDKEHVIIAGFGRVGKTIAHILKSQNISFVGIDHDSDLPRHMRNKGLPVYFGDAQKIQVLKYLNINEALALIVTVSNPQDALAIVRHARQLCPHLRIYARASDHKHARKLEAAGANSIILETVEMSLQFGSQILRDYNVPRENIEAALENSRKGAE